MVKFNLKKKVAKALVFAMVMGTVGVQGMSVKSPVTVMADTYDDETDVATIEVGTILVAPILIPSGDDETVTLSGAVTKDSSGVVLNVDPTKITWVVDGTKPNGVDVASDGTITVTSAATASTFIVKAKCNGKTSDDSVTIKLISTVKTASFEDGKLRLTNELTGNFIIVACYSDSEGKKIKTTTVYTRAEIGTSEYISLGAINLKKGGSFRVYSETIDINSAELVVANPQADKIKIKVKDITKDTLFDALEIKVGSETVSASNLTKYADLCLYTEDGVFSDKLDPNPTTDGEGKITAAKPNDGIVAKIRTAAKANGMVLYARYSVESGMSSLTKVKIPAAQKAPKVVVDYVNGTYTVPAKTKYVVIIPGEGGLVEITSNTSWTSVDKKTPLSIEDILKPANGGAAPASAFLIIETAAAAKKMSSMAVVKVNALQKLKVSEFADNVAKAKVGSTEVAEITASETGVTIKASADIAYYDSAKSKYVTIKKGATSKEIALTGSTKLKIKVLGTKPGKGETVGVFGSTEDEFTNDFRLPSLDLKTEHVTGTGTITVMPVNGNKLIFEQGTDKYTVKIEGTLKFEYQNGDNWEELTAGKTFDAGQVKIRIAAVQGTSSASESIVITLNAITQD